MKTAEKSNPVNSQETRFCWQKTSSVRNVGLFRQPIFFCGFLWDEYRLSTGTIRVSQEIHEKALFLIQNYEHHDVSIKHLQTDVLNFPRYHNSMCKETCFNPIFRHLRSHSYSSMFVTDFSTIYNMFVCTSECFLLIYWYYIYIFLHIVENDYGLTFFQQLQWL